MRSEPEFEAGHPLGSFNVPLLHMGPAGLVPNPEFLSVMQQAFGRGEKLIMGCRSGQRSYRAAEMLLDAGYTDVSNLLPGFEGTTRRLWPARPGLALESAPVELGRPTGTEMRHAKQRKAR